MRALVIVPERYRDFHNLHSCACWCIPEIIWHKENSYNLTVSHNNPRGDADTAWISLDNREFEETFQA